MEDEEPAPMANNFQKDTFILDVASVLLVAFIVIEAYSSLFSLSNRMLMISPLMEKTLSLATVGFGLVGIYGLWVKNKSGGYFSLLSVIIGIVPNCRYLLEEIFKSQVDTAFFTLPTTMLTLGILIIILLFKGYSDPESPVNLQSSILDAGNSPVNSNFYAIETENVTKKYFIGPVVIPALNGISLKIRKGEFVSIMGPSGSGKSTLLNLLGALDRPTSGKVFIDGVDISQLDNKRLAKLRNEKIGFVFQAYNLINRSTVKRNMELPALVKGYPKEERMKRINELLSIVGLSDKLNRKPKAMSGGEQQRVAIARALMNDPEIILADEPTGNVDSKTGRVIMSFFRKLNKERGTTIVVITHDPEIARMTDRIIYIRDGRIFKEERGGASA